MRDNAITVKTKRGATVWNDVGYANIDRGTPLTVWPKQAGSLTVPCRVEEGEHAGMEGLVALEDVGLDLQMGSLPK